MARKPKTRLDVKDPKKAMVLELAEQVRAEVRKRYGADLTYEQRRDAAAKVMADVLWAEGDKDLKALEIRLFGLESISARHVFPAKEQPYLQLASAAAFWT